MLRDLTNDRQLKNSETCPEQLTPGLPKVETNRAGVNTRIKNFQSKQATSQMNGGDSSVNQGKTSVSTRRNLTLDRERHRGSVGASAAMKKQASQDHTVMKKATVFVSKEK